jgi:hypothetical protein
MAKEPPFALVYADEAKQHLRAVEAKYHSLIRSESRDNCSSSPRWKPATGSL